MQHQGSPLLPFASTAAIRIKYPDFLEINIGIDDKLCKGQADRHFSILTKDCRLEEPDATMLEIKPINPA